MTKNDEELIKKANFDFETESIVGITVRSLHYLRAIASELGIPIEQITTEHIIQRFSDQEEQKRANKQWAASFPSSSPSDTFQK
jgi:hypothetical protein